MNSRGIQQNNREIQQTVKIMRNYEEIFCVTKVNYTV